MRLRELLEFHTIVIQCHDNPDADALASGFGVYRYLQMHGIEATMIYGGSSSSLKANLRLMAQTLGIPVSHVDALERPELLITVDCQYGAGNVTRFEADQVAAIDHHPVITSLPRLREVRGNLGSCATLVWQMLKEEGVDVNADLKLSTALYYGLYVDTNAFSEITHPLDKDLRDEAVFSPDLMMRYRNCNLTLEELETAGAALMQYDYNEEHRFAVVKAAACDPSVLGVISDLVLQVDAIDTCLVFSVLEDGVKFSVRSCVKEARANELADEISRGLGTGGGHVAKAGGWIDMGELCRHYTEYCRKKNLAMRMIPSADGKTEHPSPSAIQSFFRRRMEQYYDQCRVIYADSYQTQGELVEEYERLPLPFGYVRGSRLFAPGTVATLRMLQGDIDFTIEEDTILIIGAQGEIYIWKAEWFHKDYVAFERPYVLPDADYAPTIRNNESGVALSLLEYAKVCFPSGRQIARAEKLTCCAKVFRGAGEAYILGKPGDYLVEHWDGKPGVKVVSNEVFTTIYQKTVHVENGIQSVIFDLDGTLLDTLGDLTDAVNFALAKHGMSVRTIEEIRRFVGNGALRLIERSVPDGQQNPAFGDVYGDFQKYYATHCNIKTKAYPGVLALLAELKKRGIAMAIVSNKPDGAVKTLCEKYFGEYVTVAMGDAPDRERKPAPDTVEAAMEEIGANPAQTIYVGDSEVDVRTAENAGLASVLVTWGFRDPEFLLANGAKRLIHSAEALLDYIQ